MSELYRCRECLDATWVAVGSNSVRPCSNCRPVQHAHWTKGGYRGSLEGGWVLSTQHAEQPAASGQRRYSGRRQDVDA